MTTSELTGVEPAPSAEQSPAAPRPNPFVGPRSFRHGEPLFGRSSEVRDLVDSLIGQRILLLYSPSGAGKTSLLEAGLRPALEANQFLVLPTVRVGLEPPAPPPGATPRNRYLLSTLVSLEAHGQSDEAMPAAELYEQGLDEYLSRLEVPDRDLCLFFDQFEEVLAVEPNDRDGRTAFLRDLGAALSDRGRWALFAMREEYVTRLDPYLELIPTHLRARRRLDLLTRSAARDAIEAPARLAGVEFTPEAAEHLVDDLSISGQYLEPVQLQVVCRQLWSRLPEGTSTIGLADVSNLGDINQALAGYYEEQVGEAVGQSGLPERSIRDWFEKQLITDGLRHQVRQGPEGAGSDAAVAVLEDAHLVRRDQRYDSSWLELAHDRLIQPIQAANATWQREHLNACQQAAITWSENGEPEGMLLSGEVLVEAERWERQDPAALSVVERAYLRASRQRRSRSRWVRAGLVAMVVLTVTAVGLAIVAGLALTRARDAKEAARDAQDKADRISESSILLAQSRSGDHISAPLDWVEAVRLHPDVSTAPSLYTEVADSMLHSLAHRLPPTTDDGEVAVALSPDGAHFARGTFEGLVEVVDIDGGTTSTVMSTPDYITDLEFDPTSELLMVTLQGPVGARLEAWDVETKSLRQTLSFPATEIGAPIASADGEVVAVFADPDREEWPPHARLLVADARSPAEPFEPEGSFLVGGRPALSRDGSRVAAVAADGAVHQWTRTASGWQESEQPDLGEPATGSALAFDRAGARLAAGTSAGLAVLQLGDGSVRRLPNQTSAVVDVAFLAQEGLRTLADDRSVSTWAPGGDAGYRLLDTSGGLNEGTVGRFSADGRRLVLLGAQAADVEDVATGASLLRQTSIDHALGLADLAASSSGVVVVAADGSMSQLDWQGTGATAAEAAPAVAPAPLAAVGASRNGNHVATVAADGVVRLLDRAGRILRSTTATSLGLSLDDVINEASATTDAEGGWVDRGPALAVSDDGDVVTIGATTAIVSWLSSPGASPRYAVPQGARVTAMGLSPDGSYVAAGLDLSAVPQARGGNGVYVWDATSGELVTGQVLRDDITAIEFTPDGSLIMIGTDAGELRVLDTATADARLVPRYADLDGAVISIASSPDLLAVATPDSLLLFAWEEFDYATSEDPVDAYREVNLFPAEAAFVDVAFDETGSNLMAVEADGFAYVVEDVGSPVDLQWAVERAEQLIAENDADGA